MLKPGFQIEIHCSQFMWCMMNYNNALLIEKSDLIGLLKFIGIEMQFWRIIYRLRFLSSP